LEHPSCLEQIQTITKHNSQFVATLKTDTAIAHAIKNVRSLGTILAFEVVTGNDGYLNAISTDITKRALEKGVYLRPLGNTVYIMPPYCITVQQLQLLYEVIREIVAEVVVQTAK